MRGGLFHLSLRTYALNIIFYNVMLNVVVNVEF